MEGTAEVVRDPMASDDKTNYPDLTIARIPASVTYRDEEFIVTTIGSMAFADCNKLCTVELPDTITCIGGHGVFRMRSGVAFHRYTQKCCHDQRKWYLQVFMGV